MARTVYGPSGGTPGAGGGGGGGGGPGKVRLVRLTLNPNHQGNCVGGGSGVKLKQDVSQIRNNVQCKNHLEGLTVARIGAPYVTQSYENGCTII